MTGTDLSVIRTAKGMTTNALAKRLNVPARRIEYLESQGKAVTLPNYLTRGVREMEQNKKNGTKKNMNFKQRLTHTQRIFALTRDELAEALHLTPQELRDAAKDPYKVRRLSHRMRDWTHRNKMPDPALSKARTESMTGYFSLTEQQKEIKETFSHVEQASPIEMVTSTSNHIEGARQRTGFSRRKHKPSGSYVRDLMLHTKASAGYVASLLGVSADRMRVISQAKHPLLTPVEKDSMKELGVWVQANGGKTLPPLDKWDPSGAFVPVKIDSESNWMELGAGIIVGMMIGAAAFAAAYLQFLR